MSAASTAAHDAALAFLYSRIDYERAVNPPYSAGTLRLERMRELLARLGNPQRSLPTVHIAGTKGKGSTAAMVAAVLTAAGHRTGLASSPHLRRVEERLAIDGRPASGDELVELVDDLRPHVETMEREAAHVAGETGPTYFEITTALAWQHFARNRVRAAVVEVGLGGRLDATNVCEPTVTAITSISFDHTRQLGNTLAEIAGEKAGIIKPGVPIISGATQAEPSACIARSAAERESPLSLLGRDFDFQYEPARALDRAADLARIDYQSTRGGETSERRGLGLAMIGRHQGANAAVALAVLDELSRQDWNLPDAAVRHGLATATCPARVEVIGRQPTIVLDAAHNVASVAALRATLDESFRAARRILVFATTQDKDVAGMVAELCPAFDHVVFTRYTSNPRSVPAEELAAAAAGACRSYWVCPDPPSAWDHVRAVARPDDMIVIAGSFFLAADMRVEIDARPLSFAMGSAKGIA